MIKALEKNGEEELEEWEKKQLIAEVVALATKAMFKNHYYKFGGKMFHQKKGGPIGLRGTCAVARLVMQLFDGKWKNVLTELGIVVWLMFRYVDDGRVILPPIKPGWRWEDGELVYCKKWELEDQTTSGEQRTKLILKETMKGVEDYLTFTVESCEDFGGVGGWLPTLDTELRVNKENQVEFKFYEKETTTRKTVQKTSAMEENNKIKILSNDLVRRLCNTMETLGAKEQHMVIDNYSQKLLNSGYGREQVQRIIVNGIKGYEGRKNRCKKEGRKLRRTAKESQGARMKKKLLSKTSWYKGAGAKVDHYTKSTGRKGTKKSPETGAGIEHKTVLFIEQTSNGELGKRMRELMTRLAPIMGFGVKIVERNGRTLKSQFPQAGLWEGAPCGREKCTTCTQGAEMIPPCTRSSLVYENVCSKCNQGAASKRELEDIDPTIPSIYVGETSRTVKERAEEHWGAARKL